jgi:hypothetical protein
VPDEKPAIIAHRALGVGEDVENLPANVPRAFALGFGAEVDVRGDGDRPYELGHLGPNGHDLFEVFAAIRAAWDPAWAGLILIIDVADDENDVVSSTLVDVIHDEVLGTELASLTIIVQSSTIESLTRLRTRWDARPGPRLPLLFAMTYWYSPEYTQPLWVDAVAANIAELGDFRHPKPILVFGADTRNGIRRALTSRSEILGIVSDHPRRVAAW